MIADEFHKLILQRLDQHAADTKRIEGKIDRADAKVDELRVESSRQHAEVTTLLHEHDKALDRHGLRLDAHQERLGTLDIGVADLSEATGKYALDDMRSRFDEELQRRKSLEAGKTHWVRWMVTTIAGVVIAVVGALLGARYIGGGP